MIGNMLVYIESIICWIMVHGKILTAENLQKKELKVLLTTPYVHMIHHLFFECILTINVCQISFVSVSHVSNNPDSWKDMFSL